MATCNESLVLGDDFGDNEVTFRCQLVLQHSANHEEITTRSDGTVFVMTWLTLASEAEAEEAAEKLREVAVLWGDRLG